MYRGTKLWLADNSGIISVKVLQLYPTSMKRGLIGNIALVTLHRYKQLKKTTQRKKLHFTVITTIRRKLFRQAGAYYFQFDYNTGLLLTADKDKFSGTVFSVPITRELKNNVTLRLFRLSKILI